MRVGLDADGVIYQFENAVRHHLVTHRGFDPALLPPVQTYRFFDEWGLDPETFDEVCSEAIVKGVLFTWGEPYEGTAEALQKLVDAGHTLHVITARGFEPPGGAEGATKAWLTTYLPPISSLTFAKDKTLVRVDVMLEDKLSNYDALAQTDTRPYLINRPWNQDAGDTWRRRVDSMDEFVTDVLSLKAATHV